MSCASAARAWSRPRLASKRAGASKRRRAPAPRAAATRDAGPARVAVFVSGGGSNMRALHAAMLDGRVDAEVAVVVSNAPDCGGVTWARENGVPTLVYPPSKAERERNEFAWQTFYVLFSVLPAPLRGDDAASIRPFGRARRWRANVRHPNSPSRARIARFRLGVL